MVRNGGRIIRRFPVEPGFTGLKEVPGFLIIPHLSEHDYAGYSGFP
jgi:hypothetical protein